MESLITLAFAAVAVALFAATVWRPVVGLATLAIAVPLTTGMGRGTVIPLLRPNEALLIVVVAALALQAVLKTPAGGRFAQQLRASAEGQGLKRPWAGIDLAVVAFTVGGTVIPFLTLWWNQTPIDATTAQAILSPLQFLVLYAIFRYLPLAGRDIRLCLNLAMAASAVIAVLAVAQVLRVGPVTSFLDTFFPSPPAPSWDPIQRPNATLGLYSSVGAFCMLNYALALALAAVRSRDFHLVWLGSVMALDVVGVVASQTWAPALGLILATIVIVVYTRRIPRQMWIGVAGVSLALVLFGAQVASRIADQGVTVGGNFLIPETMRYRMMLWQDFYLPSLSESPWVGTGTILPANVPEKLDVSVDNEYLRVAYRAGVVGVLLLAILLVSVGLTGWRARRREDPLVRALGGAAVAYMVAAAVMGITEEYLAYGGVGQQMAIVLGIFAGLYVRPRVVSAPQPEPRVARVRVLKVGIG
jgi:hypothetical protein